MTRVKICGITEVAVAIAAAEAGADFLGMVFAPSQRQITPEKAKQIAEKIKSLHQHPEIVGVFVNATAAAVNRVAAQCHLDRIQLSGEEPWQYCREIELPVIKVLHVSRQTTSAGIIADISAGLRICREKNLICLLDTRVISAYGGTGKTFDWQLAREAGAVHPVIVAGGLTPENIKRLVSEARPWGVDVSSGVETGGRKDIGKIKAFIEAVRRTC